MPSPGRDARPRPAVIRLLARIVRSLAWRLRLTEFAWALVEKELASTAVVPWRERVSCWRHGFLGEAAAIYDLARHDRSLYLSDYARFVRTRLINGAYGVLLDDKLLLGRLLSTHAYLLPTVFGTLDGGRVVAANAARKSNDDRPLRVLLEQEGGLVVKPVTGGGGRGVAVLRAESDGFSVNGRPVDAAGLERSMALCGGYLVEELILQHPVSAALYPGSTNTLRIVTMIDDEGPFIAAAVQRIGCARSKPTDNWTGGGLSAAVDRHTGRLGAAASYPRGRRRLAWHTHHPETGAAIEGAVIPHWSRLMSVIPEIAGSLPFLPYVGWDVVVTEEGFCILEGNQYSDVNLLQIHGPLLADCRVAAFYRRHGAID